MKFKIVKKIEIAEFEKAVTEEIAKGYIPLGSPFIYGNFLCLAMIYEVK